MIPKGTLLFSYFTPNIDDFSEKNYNNVLEQILANFYFDQIDFNQKTNKFKLCLSNYNNRLKYFYLFPKYGERYGELGLEREANKSTCISYRTKRDIFVASLKNGTDIYTNYSRGSYHNHDSIIVKPCDNFPINGCRESVPYDVCINNKFYNSQKIDGNSAIAYGDTLYYSIVNSIGENRFELKYNNPTKEQIYDNYVSLMFQMLSNEIRTKIKNKENKSSINNYSELISMEEIVLLPRGYQDLPKFTDEDKIKYNISMTDDDKCSITVDPNDLNDFFNEYIKNNSPLEIISVSSYFGNFTFNHKENKIIQDLIKPSDLFRNFFLYDFKSTDEILFASNFVKLFNTIGISYNFHFGLIQTKFNLTSSEIEQLNSDIIMDVQILKSYEDRTDEVFKLLRVNGTNYNIDLTNNDNSNELFQLHVLKMICNYLLPEYRNSIFFVKYKEKEYLIDSGSTYINYNDYQINGGKIRLEQQFIFLKNNPDLNYRISFNNVYNYFKNKDYKDHIIPIAKYFPLGYNKNKERIEYVDKLDVILYNDEFIKKSKLNFNTTSEYTRNTKNIRINGGFNSKLTYKKQSSLSSLSSFSNKPTKSNVMMPNSLMNYKKYRNSLKNYKNHKSNIVKSLKNNKTKLEINKKINDVVKYGELCKNMIAKYYDIFM
jgi:hypothetical protein